MPCRNVDFHVNEGEFVSIIGPSGSGKTALLNVLGCLDTPIRGQPAAEWNRDHGAERERFGEGCAGRTSASSSSSSTSCPR